MKIAILGAGNVGSTLGRSWLTKGHEIFFGVRNPKDDKTLALLEDLGGNVRAGTNNEAIAFSDVILLAIPWQVVEATLTNAGDLSNKIIIDATNPLTPDFSALEIGFDTSGAEQVAAWAKGAKVFKTFNQTGWENMANPVYDGKPSAMMVCGNDTAAKNIVMGLVTDIGFEAIDMGELKMARLIEPFGMTWIHLAMRQGLGRDWAFQIVRR
ncbi:MAG: NADPH-dependent F420 reductase [Pleurocapsa sp. MO_226.B13]|nr:NADPH-dependent F420 reductase [Pleurocapsa sp. MO_226.B13]